MRYKKEEETALTKIYKATAALMMKKDYNQITNTDIIKEANISRSTFYMYFKTKDQILVHMCNDIFDHVFDKHLKKEKHHDFSKENNDEIKHLITHSFYHFLEDKDLILAILNSSASSIFLNQLRKRIKPLIVLLIERKIIGNIDIPLDFKIHQYINGYTALLQYYLRHANNVPPEEIASYYFTLYR